MPQGEVPVTFLEALTLANLLFAGTSYRLTDIGDGTSNTADFAERRKGDFNNGIITLASDLFGVPAAPTTPDQAGSACDCMRSFELWPTPGC